MNWFDASGLTSLAKSALKEAQKTIDKALDIQDESGEEQEDESPTQGTSDSSPSKASKPQNDDFFASWGLTVSAESSKEAPIKEQPVVTESPSKSSAQSVWGSFAGSFFEQPKNEGSTIVKPPKAKSMNVISDAHYGSQDDLFSKSQLVMSDTDATEHKTVVKDEPKIEDRRGSSRSNILSLMSSRNSSDSVEVLSHSMKTTPDSEASVHSISNSSSIGQKPNSESVEILPDSLVSPSSIECLGFDSYSSEKNSSTSSNLSPSDLSDKKSTSIGERTEKPELADSVSLVADEDEDTMSYNSISECTAPTVLDTDENVTLFPKLVKSEPRKGMEREFMLEQVMIPQKLQISENSSNDGSWSDRTLNADNDSVTLETANEEVVKESQEDTMIEKLSDSSSFYNVNVSNEMMSESSHFVNVEKKECSSQSSVTSQKDCHGKERTSPISSDSKSDLVKIGSDRTSGHTSGDEVETATSSDIEIIPSPNGDGFCRSSPAKYGFKNGKFDGNVSPSPNLVDLVLGKSLATKIRGHTRELSEASVQSNTSDESQSSENDRLMRRLCEMAEILDARENRLMEVSRSNAELVESNAELKSQVENLMSKHEAGDITMITEDYTQRMSALEKKFQQAIREKDSLRKQLDALKSKTSTDLEALLREKDDVIAQLHQEGETLAKQQLHHSNIIKKLRAKDKDNEQVIKGLRDKIAEQTSELERVKRAAAAKEELEVSQIEAVYRLTTANKKMEAELVELKSTLDDTSQRLDSTRTALEAARRELATSQRDSGEAKRLKEQVRRLQDTADEATEVADTLRAELAQLRIEMAAEQQRWVSRVEALRGELAEALERAHALESAPPPAPAAAPVLRQLASLQRAAAHTHTHHTQRLAELETSLAKAVEREKLAIESSRGLQERLSTAEALLRDTQARLDDVSTQCQHAVDALGDTTEQLRRKSAEMEAMSEEYSARVSELESKLLRLDKRLAEETAALAEERRRNALLQEQVSSRGEVSPPHSVASDCLSTSYWHTEEASLCGVPLSGGGGVCAASAEAALAALSRREGEARALQASRDQLLHERAALTQHVAELTHKLEHTQNLQEQYDALLQMYGEKEEQLQELRLDLHDVTQLYKQHLDELALLRRRHPR